jgi:TetR/AcrR family transcriptional regulator, mexJK operon transcriptional repressor
MAMSSEAKEKRRAEILAAAREVFLEKGFERASLMDIAGRAHASKETIYSWFGGKTQLIGALLEEGMKDMGARFLSERAEGTPERVLYVLAIDSLKMINLSPLIQIFVVAGAAAQRDPALKEMVASRAFGHPQLVAFLNTCRERGLMQFDDAQQMASVFIGMVQAEWPNKLSLGVIDRITDEEIEAHAKLVTQMFIKAVAPKPARH